MSRSVNKIILVGNVGQDPDIQETGNGTKVAHLSLATNRRTSQNGDDLKERTDWHRLTFFGKVADIVEQWVKKGDKLYVEGRIEYSQTQDDQGGTRYWTDIVVNEMVMLGSGQGGPSDGGTRGGGPPMGGPDVQGDPVTSPISDPDDDLPF